MFRYSQPKISEQDKKPRLAKFWSWSAISDDAILKIMLTVKMPDQNKQLTLIKATPLLDIKTVRFNLLQYVIQEMTVSMNFRIDPFFNARSLPDISSIHTIPPKH